MFTELKPGKQPPLVFTLGPPKSQRLTLVKPQVLECAHLFAPKTPFWKPKQKNQIATFSSYDLSKSNMHSWELTIAALLLKKKKVILYILRRIQQIPGCFFFFFLNQRFLAGMPRFWTSLQAKHKPLTVVDSMRTCLRRGMRSEAWLTRGGPTCARLFVVHQPAATLTDGVFALHNDQLSHKIFFFPIRDRKKRGEVILWRVAGLLSGRIVSAVNEGRKAGCRGGGGGGGCWVVRKRYRNGLKASLWMTKT